MSTKSKFLRQMLSMTLAMVMMLGIVPAAYAHDPGAEEGGDHVHDSTPYSVKVYNGEEPNRNGKLEFTVTCHEDGGVSEKYGVEDAEITAVEGDIITLYPEADEGYALSSIGYWKVDSEGREGSLVEVAADENGAYKFTMVASGIIIGAAFQDTDFPLLFPKLNSNKVVDGEEPDYSLYIANDEAYLNVGDENASVYLSIDERFPELENVSMTLEVRQYSDGGYYLAGSKTYDATELAEFIGDTEPADGKYVIEQTDIPITKELREGYNVYCVVKFNIPSWVDAKGNPMYRWAYTGTDIIIFAEGVDLPEAMVWLYNLDADSYRGALVHEILENLEIEAGTVNNENLGQRIGYMIQWPGYEEVEEPYSPNEYDVEYMLMANLTEVQLDRLLESMQDNNIRVNLKSMPTVWTASKTFEELFDIMAEEDEVLKAAIALDKMIYEAESLDEETYEESEYWDEFRTALADAIVALSKDAEDDPEGANLYINARNNLLEAYLKVTGRKMLSGVPELICEEAEEGNYKISIDYSQEGETFSCNWTVGRDTVSVSDTITVSAEDLYKVKLTITGTDNYYGEITAVFSVPPELEYDITADSSSVTVSFTKYETLTNTPEPITYTAELYKGGELQDALSNTTAEDIVFSGLEATTEYAVRIYASNIVGRTTYMNENIVTSAVIVDDWYDDEEDTAPVVKPAETPAFEDVDENAFYAEAVRWAVENNITTGVSETEFAPEMECTRAQVVTFLWRAAGAPKASGKNAFADVKADSYYYDAVMWAVENGITTGVSETEFAPDMECTRAQVVTFLNRASGEKAEASDAFDDVAEDGYYAEAANWAAQNGITTGTGERTFSPDTVCSRAQIVTFLYRMYK